MFRFSARSLRNLAGVHPDLVRVVHRAILTTPVDFVVIEGVRTKERQAELVKAGASQTMASRHITGHAVDLAAYVGEIRWDMGLYYQIAWAMQRASRELVVPVRWGGAWCELDDPRTPAQMVGDYVALRRAQGRKAFVDGPHFELPARIYK